jgi:hypothetical protein
VVVQSVQRNEGRAWDDSGSMKRKVLERVSCRPMWSRIRIMFRAKSWAGAVKRRTGPALVLLPRPYTATVPDINSNSMDYKSLISIHLQYTGTVPC